MEGIAGKRAINQVVAQIAFTVRRARIANFKSTHVSLGDLASLIIFGHPDHAQAPLDHTLTLHNTLMHLGRFHGLEFYLH